MLIVKTGLKVLVTLSRWCSAVAVVQLLQRAEGAHRHYLRSSPIGLS